MALKDGDVVSGDLVRVTELHLDFANKWAPEVGAQLFLDDLDRLISAVIQEVIVSACAALDVEIGDVTVGGPELEVVDE